MKLDIYYDKCFYDMVAVKPSDESCFSRTLHFFNMAEMEKFFKDVPEDASWEDTLEIAVKTKKGHIHAVQ